jgi:hypothetical protein
MSRVSFAGELFSELLGLSKGGGFVGLPMLSGFVV